VQKTLRMTLAQDVRVRRAMHLSSLRKGATRSFEEFLRHLIDLGLEEVCRELGCDPSVLDEADPVAAISASAADDGVGTDLESDTERAWRDVPLPGLEEAGVAPS